MNTIVSRLHCFILTGLLLVMGCTPSDLVNQIGDQNDVQGELVADLPSQPSLDDQNQIDIEAPSDTGILLTMFDGQAVDSYNQQPILSLYRLDMEGNLYHLYTPLSRNNSGDHYDVSPDGQWIVFRQEDPQNRQSDIYKIRTNGTDLTRLTDTAEYEGEASWAPDGQSIVYGMWDIDRDQAKLVRMDSTGTLLEAFDFSAPYIRALSWSPDGKWITFTALDQGQKIDELYLLNTETREIDKISQDPPSGREGVWSPDGQSLAFTVRDVVQDYVYIYDIASQESSQIVSNGDEIWQIAARAWTPDNRFVVLNGTRRQSLDKMEVWLWDTQAKALQSLTQDISLPMVYQSLSPDGKQILLAAMINGPEMQLHVLDLETNEIRPLEELPNLSFAVTVLNWGNLAELPEDSSPIAAGILGDALSIAPGTSAQLSIMDSADVTTLVASKVRSGPGISYPIVGEIEAGKKLTARGASMGQEWLMIIYDDSDTGFAWIYAELTDFDSENTLLPFVHVPEP